MSQGFLLFAHDNEQIPYCLMAAWQAKRIHKWLDKPVSLVTDQQSLDNLKTYNLDTVFDKIILSNSNTTQTKLYRGANDHQSLTFKNTDRCFAWDLTPYDETIILDTDIVIQSNRFNSLWNNQDDMLVCETSKHLFGQTISGFEYLSNYGIKFYWATVFYFKKNDESRIFFETCKRIKQFYHWYSFVHDTPRALLRNDYVWSIAVHELKCTGSIPFNLPFTLDRDSLIKLTDTQAILLSENNKLTKVNGIDIHVMNKFDLMNVVKEELNV